jgi:anti-sigma factor ChrR (cupin superfamily)
MLEQDGDEVAKATSIVRYRFGSQFPIHTHKVGEEILALEGIFSDETADFPAGTSCMKPPSSDHSPPSESGCTLFVTLPHLGPYQVKREVVNTLAAPWYHGMVLGLNVIPLMQQRSDSALGRWAPEAYLNPNRHFA